MMHSISLTELVIFNENGTCQILMKLLTTKVSSQIHFHNFEIFIFLKYLETAGTKMSYSNPKSSVNADDSARGKYFLKTNKYLPIGRLRDCSCQGI